MVIQTDGNDPLLNATIHYNSHLPGTLPNGVKYVPYSQILTVPGLEDVTIDEADYTLVSGTLPNGMALAAETGEITGVPMASGRFPFSVQTAFTANGGDLTGEETNSYILTILDNTDSAVEGSNDNDYPIIQITAGDEEQDPNDINITLPDYQGLTIVVDAPFDEFKDLYLDGRKLTRDVEYEAYEGSTVLVVYEQTIRAAGREGVHTLSAEFRSGEELKTASVNYTIRPSTPTPSKPSTPSRPSRPDRDPPDYSPKPSKPAETPKPQPAPAPVPAPVVPSFPFADVRPGQWFYEDVKWAYENKVMTGVTDTAFAPETSISQATIVTVLARMAKVDLSQFAGLTGEGIEPGKWYSEAAVWAARSGLLPDYSTFTGEETITREQMAIMLTKYLRSLGVDTSAPEQPLVFADAGQMSPDGAEAFQTLCALDIFRGVGSGRMEPEGSTTRAQFAALVHRLP